MCPRRVAHPLFANLVKRLKVKFVERTVQIKERISLRAVS
jgi:hypothetical protein